jgi:Phage QLRG family, putative DNA packaging.
MTESDKLNMVKTMLRISDTSEDALIQTYLEAAGNEILGWRYSYSDFTPQSVPKEYEMTQVQAVVNGYTQSGNEGQNVSIENGIHRHFAYSDMVRYIRANVIAIAKVGASYEA